MSEPTEHLPPLSPELEDFVHHEREAADPPAGVADGVFSRLRATLGLPVDVAALGERSAPPDHDHASRSGAPDLPIGPGTTGIFSRSSVRTLATLLMGAAAGAAIHEGLDRRAEQRHAIVQPSLSAVPSPSPPGDPNLDVPTRTRTEGENEKPVGNGASTSRVRVDRGSPPELQQRDRSLAAERTLIEQARTALSREKGEAALAALERHDRDFPHGALNEERESLLIQVLVKLDRGDQARRVGARFHRQFPRSIFGAVVDEALRSIP